MHNLDLSGVWWIPETPNRIVNGRLFFSGDDEPRLELIGDSGDFYWPEKIIETPIILGKSIKNEQITLYRCWEVNSTLSRSGLRKSEFKARAVFIGRHFLAPEELRFPSMAFRYDHLSDWASLPVFKFSGDEKIEGDKQRKLVL